MSALSELTNLVELDLNGTSINDLFPITNLVNLEKLFVANTEVSALPESFDRLIKLKTLKLRGTSISELPPSINNLSQLEELDLEDTNVVTLPVWIGQMPALQHLDLSGLTIPMILKHLALRGLPFVENPYFYYNYPGINLYGATLTEQDNSMFLEHPELIPSLYEKDYLRPARECRVIFLGDGTSGKSYSFKRFRTTHA